MPERKGNYTIQLSNRPMILSSAAVVGKKEGEGPLGKVFDRVFEDTTLNEKTWEKAESDMQKEAVTCALNKAALSPSQVQHIFAGDLLNQCTASTFGLRELNIPLYGQFGACSTMAQTLSMAAIFVDSGAADICCAVTSSHFCTAERQFRFPLEYANQRPLSASWTVTGSGAFVVGKKRSKVRITGVTTGKVVDYGIKDAQNMGAAMAPAACDTIYQNFLDFGRGPQDYDRIVTGDLGYVGQEILIKLMKEKGFDIRERHMDCGIEIYNREKQNTNAGGSGCGCSAVILSAHILPQMEKGAWKRVLFVPTGALMSTVSFHEGQSVPGIAHGVVLERGD